MRDYSIDLETGGVSPGAPIFAIGCVGFDRDRFGVDEVVNIVFDFNDPAFDLFEFDAATFKWWLQQSDQARDALNVARPWGVREGLLELTRILHLNHNDRQFRVWGNGASFDLGILAEAYRRVGLPIPWDYRNERDVRTAYDVLTMCGILPPTQSEETRHIAAKDAEHQAAVVQYCFRAVTENTLNHTLESFDECS